MLHLSCMKFLKCARLPAVVFVIILLLTGCERAPSTQTSYRQKNSARVVTPDPVGDNQAGGTPLSSLDALEEPLSTRVPMSRQDKVIQVINTNLDIDQLEEQIIVFKNTQDPGDHIRVLVADYDDIRNSYQASWQGETQASNIRSFTVYLKDLIGDHSIDIICLGMNNRGEQTLDVFRKTASSLGFGLNYAPIAAIATRGSIEIEERERSSAYQLMQKSEESFPIASYTRDPESENPSDLLKTTWYWKYQDKRYVAARTDRLPGQKIQEKQLADLFNAGEGEFEKFITGPWFRDKTAGGDIVHFDPPAKKIVFSTGDVQEIFDWASSYRTIYRSLYINCANESISSITRQLVVSVQSLDTIELRVQGSEGSEIWSGSFKKLPRGVQSSLLASKKKKAALWEGQLAGLYRNDAGLELYPARKRHRNARRIRRLQSGQPGA
jgi:hypothetical protein